MLTRSRFPNSFTTLESLTDLDFQGCRITLLEQTQSTLQIIKQHRAVNPKAVSKSFQRSSSTASSMKRGSDSDSDSERHSVLEEKPISLRTNVSTDLEISLEGSRKVATDLSSGLHSSCYWLPADSKDYLAAIRLLRMISSFGRSSSSSSSSNSSSSNTSSDSSSSGSGSNSSSSSSSSSSDKSFVTVPAQTAFPQKPVKKTVEVEVDLTGSAVHLQWIGDAGRKIAFNMRVDSVLRQKSDGTLTALNLRGTYARLTYVCRTYVCRTYACRTYARTASRHAYLLTLIHSLSLIQSSACSTAYPTYSHSLTISLTHYSLTHSPPHRAQVTHSARSQPRLSHYHSHVIAPYVRSIVGRTV